MITADPRAELAQAIARLKEERKAVILAHNYQLGEAQDAADSVFRVDTRSQERERDRLGPLLLEK